MADPTTATPAELEQNRRALLRERRGEDRAMIRLTLPAMAVVCILMVAPILWLLSMSLVNEDGSFGFANYGLFFSESVYVQMFLNTFWIALIVTAICLVLGYPVAYLLAILPSPWSGILMLAVLVPFWTSALVRTFAWLIILSNGGVANNALRWAGLIERPIMFLNTPLGVTIALVHVFLPFVILPLLGNLQAINPEVAMAGRSLGASRMRTFFKVTLPLSMPGIQAGAILVFVLSISAYVTPAMLGGSKGRTMAVLVVQYLVDNFRWPAGAALAIFMAAITVSIIVIYLRLTARAMRRLP